MEEISIKVKLGGKEHTLRVAKGDEEIIKSSAQQLNERIAGYQKAYPMIDKEDIVTMVAFDCLIDMFRAKEYAELSDKRLSESFKKEIHTINNLLAS